jgi:hypothetical protein
LSLRLGAATESGGGGGLEVAATNTISLVQDAEAFNPFLNAENQLTLDHEATAQLVQFNAVAENNIALTQSAVGTTGALNNSDISELELSHEATGELRAAHREDAESVLTFTQTVAHNQKFGPAENTLVLTQSAEQRGPLPRFASNVIELSDEAYVPRTFEVDAESELVLTQIAVASGPLTVLAESELVIVQSVDSTPDKYRDATSTLVMTSEATAIVAKLAENTITLTQLAVGNTTQRITSTLTLAQAVDVRQPIYADAESALVEYEEVFDPDTLEFVTVQTGLTGEASAALLTNPSAHDFIQWTQTAHKSLSRVDGITADAESTLSLSDEARISNPQEASNTLSLSQMASAQVSQYQPENTLELSQTATVAINRAAMALESALAVQQAVRFVIERSAVTCEYSPFVGASTDPDAPEPPSTSLPVASELTGFRLLYPATGAPTEVVTLRSPNLGDIDRLAFDRINRETRGGTLVIYADPIWPKVETLLLTFSVLKSEEKNALLAFMRATLGKPIRLIDWENRAWRGVIVNPQDPVVEDRRNSFTASFEFEGTRESTGQITPAASSSLAIGSMASRVATRSYALSSAINLGSVADSIFLNQPLRTGDGEILLTGDGEPLEAG